MKICASFTTLVMVGGWLISNNPIVTGLDESIRVHAKISYNDIASVSDKSQGSVLSNSISKNDVPDVSASIQMKKSDVSVDHPSIVPVFDDQHTNLRGSEIVFDRRRVEMDDSSDKKIIASSTNGSFEQRKETSFSPGTFAKTNSNKNAFRVDLTAGPRDNPDDEDGTIERHTSLSSFDHSSGSHFSEVSSYILCKF